MSRSTGAISHKSSCGRGAGDRAPAPATTHSARTVTSRSPVPPAAHYSGTPMSSYPLAKPSAHIERRTKIIATVGPASWDLGVLEQLIAAGADVFRLNFSHAGPDKHAQTIEPIRQASAAPDVSPLNFPHAAPDKHAQTIETIRKASDTLGRQVAILGDLPGPKLRIGNLRDDYAELETGMHVTLTPQDLLGDRDTIPVSWPGVTDLQENQLVYLADGAIRLRVADRLDGAVDAEVEVGGTLSSHKGMNIPGGAELPAATESDLGWVDFSVKHGIDIIAVSFVSSADDLIPVNERLRSLGSDIPLVAKIERAQAAQNVEEIVEAATGGVMGAGG